MTQPISRYRKVARRLLAMFRAEDGAREEWRHFREVVIPERMKTAERDLNELLKAQFPDLYEAGMRWTVDDRELDGRV